MNVYVESSAVVAWLLAEPESGAVGTVLAESAHLVASDLTLCETRRALVRHEAVGRLSSDAARERRAALRSLARPWALLDIGPEVLDRAGEPFPAEPVRSPDAIHLASALLVRSHIPDLIVLSLDHRLRSAAEGLGFPVLPELAAKEISA